MRIGGDGRNTGFPQAFWDPKSRDLDKTFPEPSKFLIQKNKHMHQELVKVQQVAVGVHDIIP